MESGKAHAVAAVAVLVLLSMALLAASARRPIGGGGAVQRADAFRALVLSGKQKPVGSSLWCCNDCAYDESIGVYMCGDLTHEEIRCAYGCNSCTCERFLVPPCICLDFLKSCPPPCHSFLSIPGKDSAV
ncbi:unnamed protein product [Spirodela intermedia]|uniref:Uncharacterized protein n=1 Tax=Spirodela intermedia TaxID=51605 RepID=A0A7I8K4C2_SPIIN|nr:unnamed protein product [Spirodela intermedia]